MTTRFIRDNELYKKYHNLKRAKSFAIEKAIKKFYSVPLETQDMECVAWETFLEVEKKFDERLGNKSYRSFYIDCLYWRVKDYCRKYANNKYKTCNLATSVAIDKRTDSYTYHLQDEQLIKKLAIEDYIASNKDNYKSVIVTLYQKNSSIEEMCETLDCSKNKLYVLVKNVRKDLGRILGMNASNF